MARTNVAPRPAARTHEGAPAVPPKNALHELRRAVMSCLLWEDTFYEGGEAIADRIHRLAGEAPADAVAALAVEARTQMKLRHAPLWLLSALAQHGRGAPAAVYPQVINRADEMGELLAMFWKNGKRPVPAAMKAGIGQAFAKFDEYQLAKYDRKVAVRLRDVLRLVHPTPKDDEQSALWRRVIDGTLATPDTWEVALSAGADKRETFTRLLAEDRLGYLALLRNLRNMNDAGVDRAEVVRAILARRGARGVLPWQFVTAALAAPMFEPALDTALLAHMADLPVLPGVTVVCVDTSGSMYTPLSAKSSACRVHAAAMLSCLVPGDVRLLQFASTVQELPARKGLAGVATILGQNGKVGHGTDIRAAVEAAKALKPDRIIVVSDMQSATAVGDTSGFKGYAINVAPYQNSVGFGRWIEINGFSDNVLRFIREVEGL